MSLTCRNILLMLLMYAATGMAILLHPTHKIADDRPKVDLETMIPKQFGEWNVDEKAVTQQIDPQRQEALNRIYNQTLARTYINQKGESIMLSIAYGGDQSNGMSVHKPEVCYPAQGFQIIKLNIGMLDTGFGSIQVKRLLATQGARIEPIIYWITVGDTVAVNNFEWKLVRMKYGLTGKVPDGLIFRVSSLGKEAKAYPVQENFIRVLLKALSTENRKKLIGNITL